MYKQELSSLNKDSDKYLLTQWIIEYIDNNMQWVRPSFGRIYKWYKMKEARKTAQQIIEQGLQKSYNLSESSKRAMEKYILPNKNSFLVIAAAGNNGTKLSHNNAGLLLSKTTMDYDSIIGVAAGCGKKYKKLCSSSNYGKEFVDILAPGEHIPVILPLETTNGTFISKATYVNGTSFSAPILTGTAALLAQCNPAASMADIKKVILENAYNNPSLESKIAGGKILDAKSAINSMCKTEVDSYSEKPKKNEDMTKDDEL